MGECAHRPLSQSVYAIARRVNYGLRGLRLGRAAR